MEMSLSTLDDLTFGETGLLYYLKTSESLKSERFHPEEVFTDMKLIIVRLTKSVKGCVRHYETGQYFIWLNVTVYTSLA